MDCSLQPISTIIKSESDVKFVAFSYHCTLVMLTGQSSKKILLQASCIRFFLPGIMMI